MSNFYMIKKCCVCKTELELIPCEMENHGQMSHGFCARCLDHFREKNSNRKLAPLIVEKYNFEENTACISRY